MRTILGKSAEVGLFSLFPPKRKSRTEPELAKSGIFQIVLEDVLGESGYSGTLPLPLRYSSRARQIPARERAQVNFIRWQ